MKRYYSMIESPLGPLCLVADVQGLCGVFFEEHRHQGFDPEWKQDDALKIFQETRSQFQEYFSGRRQRFDVPIGEISGTPFQQEVWQALHTIPYGKTCSYGALAQSIGRPKAVRALGAANGRNPLSIIVPCHRVIAGNGDLQGYSGGLERKRRLLEWEREWVSKS